MDGRNMHRTDDRLYVEDNSETPQRRRISPNELMQGLMRSVTTQMNPGSISSGDRFMIQDISHENGIPRYIRWDSVRSIFLTDTDLDTADPTTESEILSASRQSVAESLAAIAESQLVISNGPTNGQVLGYVSGEMTWVASGQAQPTHTDMYMGASTEADATNITATLFTGSDGVAFLPGSDTETVPGTTPNAYLWILRLSTDAALTFIDLDHGGFNNITDFTLHTVNLTIFGAGDIYDKLYRSNNTGTWGGLAITAR